MIFSAAGLTLYLNKTTFATERISLQGDPEKVSWCRGRNFGLPSGNNFLLDSSFSPDKMRANFLFFGEIECALEISEKEGGISYHYLFRNQGKKAVELEEGDLGIYTTFYDDLDEPELALRRRVHAHVRPQGVASVFCERYSGKSSLGLVFLKGESFSYSLERTTDLSSRGDIILNLPAMTLEVGATYECEFLLFSALGREDFYRKAETLGVLCATASESAVFPGEEITLHSRSASVLCVGEERIPFVDGVCRFRPEGSGEKTATILADDGRRLILRYFVLDPSLREKRASFVIGNQQQAEGAYTGAFTAYDRTQEECILRNGVLSPFNMGGFRAAPLLFLLLQARKKALSPEMEEAVRSAIDFYDREIYRGGVVADDVGGKSRLLSKCYDHYPLFAAIKLEEYRFLGNEDALLQSAVILANYYKSGSLCHVTPAAEVVESLRLVGRDKMAEDLQETILAAADALLAAGDRYSMGKITYDLELVCGSASTLSDAFLLTEREEYLKKASEEMLRLRAFSFPSLDYATCDVPEVFRRDLANGLYYDMSPHFSVSKAVLVFEKYSRVTQDADYRMAAERILRACLSLFDEKGKGCRSKSAVKCVNDIPLKKYEGISCGEDVILYLFDLLFPQD